MTEADHPPQPDDPQTVLPAPPDRDEPGGPEPRPSTWARRSPVITEIKSLFDQDRAEEADPEEAEPAPSEPARAEPGEGQPEAAEPEVVDPVLAQERPPALSVASSAAVRWARDSLATLGELDGRRMDRQAVDVNEHRIGKLEPEWSVPRRIRSFVILVVLTLFVAAVIAAVLAIAVEVLSVAVNHAVSKSAGA